MEFKFTFADKEYILNEENLDYFVNDEENQIPIKDNTVVEEKKTEDDSAFPKFTVIIVTFNEPLLYKTFVYLL